MRFLDGSGADIIPRKDRVWTVGELAERMITVLEKKKLDVPEYLRLVSVENDVASIDEAVFSMACFWTGEYKIGKLPGVVSTAAGWFDGREVTRVLYHRKLTSLPQLVDNVAGEQCAQRVYLRPEQQLQNLPLPVYTFAPDEYRDAKPDDQKKQLTLWPQVDNIRYLSPIQKMWLNSWGPDDRDKAKRVLSPRQRTALGS